MLEGFDASGQPKLRPAKRPITLKQLLTHTSGFTYDTWDANSGRYAKVMQMPHRATDKVASIDPVKRVMGLIMTQVLPFAHPRVLKLSGQLERGVYSTIG